ncbi:MAG: hypothetical protein RIG84_04275 [Roseovarius sp.]
MSTWISDRLAPRLRLCAARGALLAALLPLAGCLGEESGALGFLSGGRSEPVARDVLRKVELYEGEVVVRGPPGYCIDRKTMRRRETGGFVLLASCEALSGVRGQEVPPVVMTVSVLPGNGGTPHPGVEDVARSVSAGAVLGSVERSDMTLVHLDAGGDQILPGGDPRHWRGAMVLNGHLVGVALYAPLKSPMAGDKGRALLTDLARGLRRESPVLAPSE